MVLLARTVMSYESADWIIARELIVTMKMYAAIYNMLGVERRGHWLGSFSTIQNYVT